ncbi:MAG TPA: SMP-30/gluconolactonase/LRE family protein [Kofleriaceae bacterium]|nr:SMP-30/gluconolactonase/LRE family protein [Kofleriaceae bacterium]
MGLALAACGRDEPARPVRVAEELRPLPPISTAARRATVVVDGLAAPESVVHDTVDDVYLVSNVNGDPGEADGNGFISRVSPDGQVLVRKWIDGERPGTTLHAPRGLAIDHDTLYAVDVDALRLFDRRTGAPIATWPIPHPHFPNDITIDDHGRVWITETGVHIRPDGEPIPDGPQVIWRYDTPGGAPTAVATGDALAGPNGIVWTADGPVIAGLLGAALYRLAPDGSPRVIAELPLGRLDGLVALPDGSFLTTSWLGKAVYHVSTTGEVRAVVNGADILTPASIEYDRARGRVIIPLLKANQLRIETWP